METLPPTVQESLGSLHSKSYFSPVPVSILNAPPDESIILGVDEAGRGPVLGPMVYGVAYCTQTYMDTVIKPQYEFDDSKKLTDPVRRRLFKLIYEGDGGGKGKRITELGYATTCVTPCDISSGMFRFPPSKQYNLNEQAHDVTMALIQGVLDRKVNVRHVFVDTVGPPASYQRKLEDRFPGVGFTVTKKADSLYSIVSVASVIAKVTRDIMLEMLQEGMNLSLSQKEGSSMEGVATEKVAPRISLGSGYPGDPNTKAWLREARTPFYGWPADVVRFSWQTCQTLLDDSAENGTGIGIQWEEDLVDKKGSKISPFMEDYLSEHKTLDQYSTEKIITLDSWYQVE